METSINHKRTLSKEFLIGILTAVTVSLFVVPMFKLGISPLPGPPSLAFAQKLTGIQLPLSVGLLFHIAYVTSWSVIFLEFISKKNSFKEALLFGLILWFITMIVFFPIIGWGLFGFTVGKGPKLMIGALLPHFLFSVFLWIYSKKLK